MRICPVILSSSRSIFILQLRDFTVAERFVGLSMAKSDNSLESTGFFRRVVVRRSDKDKNLFITNAK